MSFYRTIPRVINAIQYSGNDDELCRFLGIDHSYLLFLNPTEGEYFHIQEDGEIKIHSEKEFKQYYEGII